VLQDMAFKWWRGSVGTRCLILLMIDARQAVVPAGQGGYQVGGRAYFKSAAVSHEGRACRGRAASAGGQ
jgi:hypothetical protein